MHHRAARPDVSRAREVGQLLGAGDGFPQRQTVGPKGTDINVEARQQGLVFSGIDQFGQAVEPTLFDHRLGYIQLVEDPGQRVPVDRHRLCGEKRALGVAERQPLHIGLAVYGSVNLADADAQAGFRLQTLDLPDYEAMAGVAVQPDGSADQTHEGEQRQGEQAAQRPAPAARP